MKKNRRIITVDGNKYVWWYEIGVGLSVVTVSPFEDKTSKVRIEFRDTEHDCDTDTFLYFLCMLNWRGIGNRAV